MFTDSCTLPLMPRTKQPDGEKKTETLSTRVTPTVAKQFKAIADADRRTTSFLLEDVVKAFIADHSPDSTRAGKTKR